MSDEQSAPVDSEASDDVIVVGGGLGGYAAALAAAREGANVSVRLLVTDDDRFDRESGLLNVLGATPDSDGPVADPVAAISALAEDHPYRTLGVERVESALRRFDEVAGERYIGGDSERNALVPTAVGRLQPAARYPASMANGLVSEQQPVRLVGFDRIPDFDTALAADRLHDIVEYDVEYSTIKAPDRVEKPPVTRKIATALDENQASDSGTTTRESLADRLRSVLDIEPRVGVPAVLGLSEAVAVRETLESQLQARIFEVPLGPPSIPGQRLESQLSAALTEAGVEIERNVSVADVEVSDGAVEELTVDRPDAGEVTRSGSAFVLATGDVAAGGLAATRSELREPLFDCQVSVPADAGEWVDQQFLGNHGAVRAGVAVDDELRAMQDSGKSFENLYAAGRVIAGPNVVAEKSAAGVALTTGDAAGTFAVE